MSGIWHFIIFLILFCINTIGYAEKNQSTLLQKITCLFHEELLKKAWVFEIVKEAFERCGYVAKIDFIPWQIAVQNKIFLIKIPQ
ncbi:MAG: hypothetical protein AB8G05_16465 [Oligoflexales bacterium]